MRFGFVKPYIDVHTLGLNAVAELVKECGYYAIIADSLVSKAVEKIHETESKNIFIQWLKNEEITHLGFSFRLDPQLGLLYFGRMLEALRAESMPGNQLKYIAVSGLPGFCEMIKHEHHGRISTFTGEENPVETMIKLGIPAYKIPLSLSNVYDYDQELLSFGKYLTDSEAESKTLPVHLNYSGYGTNNDNIVLRTEHKKLVSPYPVFRAHAGPFLPDRQQSLRLFSDWVVELASAKELDVLSIGSSQFSQSDFGRRWDNKDNGGGVPFNTEEELVEIYLKSRPLLLRAYSGTRHIPDYALMLDRSIHNAWHALSLWWFNKLDGRGPLSMEEALKQHFQVMGYIAQNNKVFEPNTAHHFSFRGADDLSSVVAAVMASKLAKLMGIPFLILQNMMNTPKTISFKQDIIKTRALLKLVKSLEDKNFKVFFQPRAGLDYFSSDTGKAKNQLAAVTALMQDAVYNTPFSIDIIHVVSYSEGVSLATPDIIHGSINICKAAFDLYPSYRSKHDLKHFIMDKELIEKTDEFTNDALKLIHYIEKSYSNVYSPEGFHKIFQDGVFPVPYLWEGREMYSNACSWKSKNMNGAMELVSGSGKMITIDERINILNVLRNQQI